MSKLSPQSSSHQKNTLKGTPASRMPHCSSTDIISGFFLGVPNARTYCTAAVWGYTPTPFRRLGRHAILKTKMAGASRSKIENEYNPHTLWSPVTSASCCLYLYLQCGRPSNNEPSLLVLISTMHSIQGKGYNVSYILFKYLIGSPMKFKVFCWNLHINTAHLAFKQDISISNYAQQSKPHIQTSIRTD